MKILALWEKFYFTRIHSDEDSTRPDQVDLTSLKHKSCSTSRQSRQNGQNLLRHYRQYFNVDAVELVKAAPCSSLHTKYKGEVGYKLIKSGSLVVCLI